MELIFFFLFFSLWETYGPESSIKPTSNKNPKICWGYLVQRSSISSRLRTLKCFLRALVRLIHLRRRWSTDGSQGSPSGMPHMLDIMRPQFGIIELAGCIRLGAGLRQPSRGGPGSLFAFPGLRLQYTIVSSVAFAE